MTRFEIVRVRPETAGLFEDFLRAEAEGDPEAAVAGFRASRARFDLLASDSFWLLAALSGGQAAGCATAARLPKADARGGYLFVDELRVLPAWRRQGTAGALLAHVEALAGELGLAGVRLLARPENEAARALYRHRGYRESGCLFFEKSA